MRVAAHRSPSRAGGNPKRNSHPGRRSGISWTLKILNQVQDDGVLVHRHASLAMTAKRLLAMTTKICLLCLIFFLSACSPDFFTPRHVVSVSTYGAPDVSIKIHPGMTFAISSLKPEVINSLEFRAHAQMLSQVMIAQGYQPATNLNVAPDFFILLSYEISQPTIRQDALSAPATMVSNGRGTPMWIQGGPSLVNFYPHQAHIQIVSGQAQPQEGSSTALFEGTAKLELRYQDMAKALPSLLRALLIQRGLFSTTGQWQEVVVLAPQQ